jgi:hypothetical protein
VVGESCQVLSQFGPTLFGSFVESDLELDVIGFRHIGIDEPLEALVGESPVERGVETSSRRRKRWPFTSR